jgi:hypothetical protein
MQAVTELVTGRSSMVTFGRIDLSKREGVTNPSSCDVEKRLKITA